MKVLTPSDRWRGALNRKGAIFNLPESLAICTIGYHRAVIRFLQSEGINPRETHERVLQQDDDACTGERKVNLWEEAFKMGELQSTNGRHVMAVTDENVGCIFVSF